MPDLLAARSPMAISLACHSVFAVVGIGMPVLMVVAERRWQRTGERIFLELAHRWAKGTAILFAGGAVSGTVLSFELGLLWPGFMAHAGAIIGMPFSLEGFACFTEAIFLGLYLYGGERIAPRAHLTAGVLVGVSGALSGLFVVIANAWMNTPTGLVVPGIHALRLLPDPRNAFHRRALVVALRDGALSPGDARYPASDRPDSCPTPVNYFRHRPPTHRFPRRPTALALFA
jgi:cytochrome bd-type quinol oxidase subunit 1